MRYFDRLCKIVKCPDHQKLLTYLYEKEYIPFFQPDENRAMDGTHLRERFRRCSDNPQQKTEPCSMLEMMVALSLRCEEHIMSNPDIGDRTSEWFHEMLESTGLIDMTDSHFNSAAVDYILKRFMSNEYSRNGKGGLFTINSIDYDMRNMEIWYQMCAYLHEMVIRTGE